MHVDVSAEVSTVQGLAFVAFCEHVLHAEHVVPSPKYPALQTHVGTFAVLPAAQLTVICAFEAAHAQAVQDRPLP